MCLPSKSNRFLAFSIITLLLVFANQSWADTTTEPVKQIASEQASDCRDVTGRFVLPAGAKPLDLSHSMCHIALTLDEAAMNEAPLLGESAKEPFSLSKRVRLSKLRGKLVLLEFSAAGCGGCHLEVPAIKAIWEQFHEDERFTMLGLFVDEKPEHAIDGFINKHDLPWQCAYLGSLRSSTTVADYGVSAIPACWLIGPDGKLLARDLRGEEKIKDAIEKAMDLFTN